MRPDDPSRLALLLAAATTTLLGILFWESHLLLPLKLLTVLFHELGHALAALAFGGEVERIEVSLREGGLTTYRLPEGLLAQVAIGSAGYLGSACFGTLLLLLYGRRRRILTPRRVTAALGALLLTVTLLYARDLVSLAVILSLAVLLLAGARLVPERPLRLFGFSLSTFVSLYALFDLRSDVLRLPWESASEASDAARLAELTGIPALLWALLWTAVAAAGIAAALLYLARPLSKPHTP